MLCLLLADVFQQFGNRFAENLGFVPYHYLSPPTLCRDVMLCMTKVKLNHISDTMCLFFENQMTGGVLYISHKYSKQ